MPSSIPISAGHVARQSNLKFHGVLLLASQLVQLVVLTLQVEQPSRHLRQRLLLGSSTYPSPQRTTHSSPLRWRNSPTPQLVQVLGVPLQVRQVESQSSHLLVAVSKYLPSEHYAKQVCSWSNGLADVEKQARQERGSLGAHSLHG